MTSPWPTLSAVSSESESRFSSPGLITNRSTTTSMVCFFCLSSAGSLRRKLDVRAVDAGAQEPLARHLLELLLVLALLAAHVGRVEHQLAARRQLHDAVDHLLHGLRPDRRAAIGAVRHADRGVEQAQVVVDLGHRAHRRARVLGHRLLLDRDRRRQAVDRVDVGLLHLLQELPRVGRERLDVAPLALGEESVEGERRLAGAGDAGDHDELAAGDLEVEILQIVLAGAANGNRIHRNRPL